MKFKNLKIKNLIIDVIICLLYPTIKLIKTKSILIFSDSLTIIGLVLVIVGVVNSFFLHGDLDITGFIASRAFNKDAKDFQAYMDDQEDKRKGSFNYPLLCSIIILIIAYISGLFFWFFKFLKLGFVFFHFTIISEYKVSWTNLLKDRFFTWVISLRFIIYDVLLFFFN